MILDANILLYAVDETSPHHPTARRFLEEHLNGEARVGLPWQSIGAFLRIATHPRVMREPLGPTQAAGFVDDWLDAPVSWVPRVDETTWAILARVLADSSVTGNLVPDAQLAALGIQYGVPVASADSDFARFDAGWVNPLAG